MQNSLEPIYTINVEGKKTAGIQFHPNGNDMLSLSGEVVLVTSLANKNKQR